MNFTGCWNDQEGRTWQNYGNIKPEKTRQITKLSCAKFFACLDRRFTHLWNEQWESIYKVRATSIEMKSEKNGSWRKCVNYYHTITLQSAHLQL